MKMRPMKLVLGVVATLVLIPSLAQASNATFTPDATWNCGMADGIPKPERGTLAFTIEIPLDRTAHVGKTPYGDRRIAVGREGAVKGSKLTATVMPGMLDYALTLANGVIEIEQLLVLRTNDGSYLYLHNAGVGPDERDVRVVVDIEAPNASQYAGLNAGHYVARREVNGSTKKMSLRVYDVTDVAVNMTNAVKITKPPGFPAQPWDDRRKGTGEQQGEMLVRENVTLGPSEQVGASKNGVRNIIPITGGVLSGRISGKVLMGGADYQHLSPPVTIDAHYLWQATDGEIIIVRNAGSFGALVPTFEARVDGPYAFLNKGLYLSSNPGMGQGGVGLTLYDSRK